ncbi:MAG: AAA family ATPase [Chloroflexi bacterium]|nr:AAA family ATPase [Chloroflexota bacterium]
MKRILIVGTTGSGKTTLARKLAQRLGYPHIELDALFWEPNWAQADYDVFRERVSKATEGECWIADGNYTSKARDILWGRGDTVVWLDYGLARIMWQLVTRTLRRVMRREALWNENRESLREQLFTRDSLFLWALKTQPMFRRHFRFLLTQPEFAHLRVVQLGSPRETAKWLKSLDADERGERG